MSRENILKRIKSVIDNLPTSERKIGQAILKDPSLVINMTAQELADFSGSSPATVIRFCKKIDIQSYTQLKIKLSAEIETPTYEGYSDINVNESIEEIKQKLLANAYQSMQDTISILNDVKVEEFVDRLISAPVIYAYGVGASYLVAENFSHKWSRIGKTVICIQDIHILLTMFVSAPEQSLFFAISNSGETTDITELAIIAKKYDIYTVGLTQFGKNSLSSKVDLSIQTVKSNESRMRSAATTSLHDQFIVIDVLFYAYASRNFDNMIDKIEASREEVKKFK